MHNQKEAQTLASCPVCNSTNIHYVFTGRDRLHKIKGSWPLWRCTDCHTHFLNPMPSSVAQFYPKDYYAYHPPCEDAPPNSQIKRIAWKWRNSRIFCHLAMLGYPNIPTPNLIQRLSVAIHPVKRHLPRYVPNGHFLDVGCGAGHYLMELKKVGWNAVGVEININACLAARSSGLVVHHGNLQDAHFPENTFDHVRMADVFEHLAQPHQILREVKRILKPGGRLEMTMPNIDSWTFRLFQEYWFPLEIPRHLFHYAPKGIGILATKNGFKIEKIRIWSHKEVDVIPSIGWLLEDRLPTIYNIIDSRWMWKLIRKLFAIPKAIAAMKGKGSAMTVILVK